MCQLPLKTSIIYPFIQKLFDVIFHPSNIFLTWGNEDNEMLKFQEYEFVNSLPLTSLHIINVQQKFKNWYNNTYKHGNDCPTIAVYYNNNNIDDSPHCTCIYRPYKNPDNSWSLQMAISTIYNQFLDKSWTRSNWGQGLDIRLYLNLKFNTLNYNVKSSLTSEQERIQLKLVNYAIDDCFAVTKLAFKIGHYLFK
ncbi:unnamed protein product [Adineta steineri]|uniref:Uncharacterized protein n=1 Tax=Adineta steineri TaxID=433720 RepID=A0A815S6G0_9BILA|nr:unnamed protein product [Adineta steineri]CAF4155476.1 unnamed protein product [Adineta steineri]